VFNAILFIISSDDDVITQEEMKELYERLGDPKAAIKEALMHFDKNKNGGLILKQFKFIYTSNV
jgi:hypothetical protein